MSTVTGSTNATPNPATTAAGTTAAKAGGAQIAGNFQQFLTLLTTQLRNQSPLDPLDTNQFTQQLVQFASVEQQLKTNDTLASLLVSTQAATTANAAGYVGLTVSADGATQNLSNGSARWTLTSAKAVAKATVTIKDAGGAVVTTKTTSLAAGAQPFTWDGKNASGITQPGGAYSISVTGVDAAGQPVTVSSDVSGTVDSVDVSGASPLLTIDGTSVPLASVKTLASR